MLLHVAITRAADHLWIIGHQPMAYGLELSANLTSAPVASETRAAKLSPDQW
jgi:hypothetical protein